ncbi:MAG: hypothetical protein P1S59_06120 [bacterium]|nr:hypothetical protein [bacterium]
MLYNPVTMDTAGTNQILQTLENLCHLESAMAAYYLACSENWKSVASLWMELAIEEERHEKIIGNLTRVVEAHLDQFKPGLKVEPTAISSFVENINEKTSDLMKGQVTLSAALNFALVIEESIIEGRFFEIIISQNPTYLKFMEVMSRDLAQHRQMIIEEIEKTKKGD